MSLQGFSSLWLSSHRSTEVTYRQMHIALLYTEFVWWVPVDGGHMPGIWPSGAQPSLLPGSVLF